MSSISSVSGANSAWSTLASNRASQMREKMFAKADADSSGSVDSSELQGMLDKFSEKTGTSLGTADDLMSKMDTSGDGSLSQDELADGMQSVMPPPPSTMAFAQQRTGHAGGDGDGDHDGPPPAGGPGGPPPAGATSGASSSTSASSTDSSTLDPLDTNQDGTVSAEERLVGALKDILAQADGNGDKKLSGSEASSFKDQLSAAIDNAIKQYTQTSGTAASASSDSTVSLTA